MLRICDSAEMLIKAHARGEVLGYLLCSFSDMGCEMIGSGGMLKKGKKSIDAFAP